MKFNGLCEQILRYSRRLEGGLFALQQVSVMLVFVGIYSESGIIQVTRNEEINCFLFCYKFFFSL